MITQKYHDCEDAISVAKFWVNSIACSGEFHGVFEHFEDLRNPILNILKEKLTVTYLVASSYLEIALNC